MSEMSDGLADPVRQKSIRANMFPAAHSAIENWATFPWHVHAQSQKSSQILAIDVFGTIKTRPPADRDAVIAAIAKSMGINEEGPWQVHLEWQDAANALGEITPTQVDAAAISENAIILFECKFTEAGGSCSQIKQNRRGVTACDGAYHNQKNPQNSIEASCALSGKGIRYWDFIPAVFGLDRNTDHAPCPFAFDNYQWMRNSVLAHTLREATGKSVRLVAAYADAPFLQTAAKAAAGLLGQATTLPGDAVTPISYQSIIGLAAAAAPSSCWSDLQSWVDAKIERQRPEPRVRRSRS